MLSNAMASPSSAASRSALGHPRGLLQNLDRSRSYGFGFSHKLLLDQQQLAQCHQFRRSVPPRPDPFTRSITVTALRAYCSACEYFSSVWEIRVSFSSGPTTARSCLPFAVSMICKDCSAPRRCRLLILHLRETHLRPRSFRSPASSGLFQPQRVFPPPAASDTASRPLHSGSARKGFQPCRAIHSPALHRTARSPRLGVKNNVPRQARQVRLVAVQLLGIRKPCNHQADEDIEGDSEHTHSG